MRLTVSGRFRLPGSILDLICGLFGRRREGGIASWCHMLCFGSDTDLRNNLRHLAPNYHENTDALDLRL